MSNDVALTQNQLSTAKQVGIAVVATLFSTGLLAGLALLRVQALTTVAALCSLLCVFATVLLALRTSGSRRVGFAVIGACATGSLLLLAIDPANWLRSPSTKLIVPTLSEFSSTADIFMISAFAALSAVSLFFLPRTLSRTITVQSASDELFGIPTLTVVSRVPKMARGRDQLYLLNRPLSAQAEAIRLLRTNIEFAAGEREISTLAIASSVPGEGKSTIAANLSVAMAQCGFSVILLDANLRHPVQHRIFDVTNARGLTTLLTRDGTDWRSAGVEVINDLWLIPSGPLPPNPADLLSGDRLRTLLVKIQASVDIVIVDTPATLAASDALVVAGQVDATLLVGRADSTRPDEFRRTVATLQKGSIRLIGVVLNCKSSKRARDHYSFYSE